MEAPYVELRCRSAFSFLDGASQPEDLVAAAADHGADALALGDRDGVYGAPRFFAAARSAGVRPIVGADVTLAGAPPVLLLVENRRGYQNLCRLLTAACAASSATVPRGGSCLPSPARAAVSSRQRFWYPRRLSTSNRTGGAPASETSAPTIGRTPARRAAAKNRGAP